ncbi:MAG: hypothetical protein M0Q26_12190, partial [Chitinophagaceae bacterium]|nr:hypothetical protein [Chitinophagaceae bacterium]
MFLLGPTFSFGNILSSYYKSFVSSYDLKTTDHISFFSDEKRNIKTASKINGDNKVANFDLSASITGTTTVCKNAVTNVTFTGSGGTVPYTFSYFVTGVGGVQFVSTSGGSSSVDVLVPTSGGNITYTLLGVTDGAAGNAVASGTAVVTVNALPTATISGTLSVCKDATSPNLTITGAGGTAPYTFTYNINSGASQTVVSNGAGVATLAAPTSTTGTFTYNLVQVQESSVTSCVNSTSSSATITVNPNPTFTAVVPPYPIICQGVTSFPVGYTTTGSPNQYKIIWDATASLAGFQDVNPTFATNNLATFSGTFNVVNVPTNVSGTFNGTLTVKVSSTGCSSSPTASSVLINPLPTASISGNLSVCQNGSPQTVTITGSGGTLPYTFTYTLNGVTQTATTSGGSSSVNVTAATGTVGTFSYTLVSVQESSSTTCSNTASGSAIITVNPLPTASISGNLSVCQNGSPQTVTITGSGGTLPYTFTYTLNGVTQTATTSGGSSSVNITAATGTVGTFSYTLVSVQESSSTTCSNTASGSAIITVNPLPTASISGNLSVCQNGSPQTVTITGSGGTLPYTFTYTLNGVTQTATTSGGSSSVNITAATGTVGTFSYTLVSVQESSSTTCSNTASGSAIITINAIPSTPVASNSGAICAGSTLTLSTANVTGGTFTWTGPNSFSSSLQNPTVVTATTGATGTYSVTVSVNSCVSTAGTTSATINAIPSTPVVTNGGAICAGSTLTLSTANVTGGTFTWTGPNSFSSSLQNPTIVTATTGATGTYSVTVSVNSCVSTAGTTAATVNAIPSTPVVTNGGAICAGSTLTLSTANVTGGTFTWTGPNSFSSSLQNPTIVTATTGATGTYSVTVSVNSCVSAAGTTAAIVNAIPSTPVVTNGGAICAGSTLTLSTANVTGGTFTWTGPNSFSS